MAEYIRRLATASARGELPKGYSDIRVVHDDWCPHLTGSGVCRCDPIITLKTFEGKLMSVTRKGRVRKFDG